MKKASPTKITRVRPDVIKDLNPKTPVKGGAAKLSAHRSRVECCLRSYSPIAGSASRSDFNKEPHHRTWEALAGSPGSFSGVDQCLRIWETVDPYHSRLVHVGLCGRGIARHESVATPREDAAFHRLQRDLIGQFLSIVEWLGLDKRRLQASCCGAALVTEMKRHLKVSILNLGLSYRDVLRVFQHFQRAGA